MKLYGIIFFTFLLLTGCAGVGVVATSDPDVKLNDAMYLVQSSERPLIAERLIFEAMEIFQSREDIIGLGDANRQYAELLNSYAVVQWENYYQKHGFRDPSVTYDNRLQKAKEYFANALAYYQKAEPIAENVARLYFNMGVSYFWLGDTAKACQYMEQATAANQSAFDSAVKKKSAYEEMQTGMSYTKGQIGCN